LATDGVTTAIILTIVWGYGKLQKNVAQKEYCYEGISGRDSFFQRAGMRWKPGKDCRVMGVPEQQEESCNTASKACVKREGL
jgi:hypothetical protein